MSPALVILAAGMGSRYGGLKQMDALGPAGQTILDYSIHDARQAGFAQVVFVIRRDFEDEFRTRIGQRHASSGLDIRYAFQQLDDLPAGRVPPPGREKPWGTGHAVWCARAVVDRPFAVINADDFYGADAYRRLASFLASTEARGTDFAMVGYPLGHTLSEHGTVARGICQVSAAGALIRIEEQTALERASSGACARLADGSVAAFPADTIVSMNCWAFTPALFPLLETQLIGFLDQKGGEAKAEFYLPAAIGALISQHQARVQVLPTDAHWFGVTYRDDKPRVQSALQSLHAAGQYAGPGWPPNPGRDA
jgi:UTP-glucose-1-phosphate uridylyltransferase